MLKFVLVLLLMGCTVTPYDNSVSFSHMHNGKKVYKINCDGEFSDISECHQQASHVCEGNYDIETQVSDAIATDEDVHVFRTILFSCQSGEAKYVLF